MISAFNLKISSLALFSSVVNLCWMTWILRLSLSFLALVLLDLLFLMELAEELLAKELLVAVESLAREMLANVDAEEDTFDLAADEMIGGEKFLVEVKVEAGIIVAGLDLEDEVAEDEVAEDEIAVEEKDDLEFDKASFAALCS